MTDVNTLVVEATGAVLTEHTWLVSHPDATNLITDSRDLTGWSVSGTPVVQYDRTGITGEPSTATYLEDDDGATAENVYIEAAISNGDSVTHRVWISKLASSNGNTVRLRNEIFGGTDINADVYFDAYTGLIVSDNSDASEVINDGDWWVVLFTHTDTNNDNTTSRVIVYPSGGTAAGNPDVSQTGSIIVGQVESHQNKTIAEVKAFTPIFTEGAAVTAGITPQYQPENHSDTQGPYYLELDWDGQDTKVLGDFLSIVGGQLQLTDGTNLVELPITPGHHKVGVAFGEDAGSMALNLDGAWSADETYDGSLPIGALLDQGITAREIKRYPHSDYLVQKARLDELMIPDAAIAVTHSSQYVAHGSAYITHTED